MKTTKTRRKTYPDGLVSAKVIDKLIDKVFESVADPYANTQQNVVRLLLPMGFSNKIIARVINATVIGSNATAGSVASIVNRMRKQEKQMSELLSKIGEV